MNESEKRDLIKFILSSSFIKLVEEYRASTEKRQRDMLIYSIALLKRFQRLKAKPIHIEKLNKFLKYTTGVSRVKPVSSDSSENAEQP